MFPGSGTTAVLLALLMTLNITPGPLLFQERPEVVWGLIAALLIANIVLLILNVPMVRFFVKITERAAMGVVARRHLWCPLWASIHCPAATSIWC